MKRILRPVLVLSPVVAGVLLLATTPTAGAWPADGPRVRVALVSEVASVQPGEPFWVAFHQRIAPGWHTYWKNPGDSGEPPTLEWTLPPGAIADDISWPAPQRISVGPAMNYGYEDEVLLPVRITPPSGLRAGDTLALRAAAAWLVCEKECIPEAATIALTGLIEYAAPQALAVSSRALTLRVARVLSQIIDRQGVLVYAGAIDDRPTTRREDVQTAHNYVREALAAVMAGQPVKNPVTRPYGCTVTYT